MTPSPLHRRTPRQYRPLIVAWSGAECALCADPVTYVVLDATGERVAIDRRPHTAGMIAARIIGPQMHGYRLGKGRPLVAGYTAFREHTTVCEQAPPPPHEQPGLFDDTEGNDT
jgi:hypothetical protein